MSKNQRILTYCFSKILLITYISHGLTYANDLRIELIKNSIRRVQVSVTKDCSLLSKVECTFEVSENILEPKTNEILIPKGSVVSYEISSRNKLNTSIRFKNILFGNNILPLSKKIYSLTNKIFVAGVSIPPILALIGGAFISGVGIYVENVYAGWRIQTMYGDNLAQREKEIEKERNIKTAGYLGGATIAALLGFSASYYLVKKKQILIKQTQKFETLLDI